MTIKCSKCNAIHDTCVLCNGELKSDQTDLIAVLERIAVALERSNQITIEVMQRT
jgi:hypothetical protein